MNATHDGWIFTRTRKFAPNGRIQIGQILPKPFQPESALMPFGPLTPPEKLAEDITKDENVDLSTETELTALFKLWANVNLVSVTASSGAHLDRSNSLIWHFDSLESRQISPPLSYVQDSIKHGEVPQYLNPPTQKKSRWSFAKKSAERRIFMVTGVTVAQGARMARKNTRAAGAGISGSVDPSGTRVVAAGGKTNIESKHMDNEELGASSNFVFAYSVNEVFWRTLTHAPFRKGEVQNVDNSSAPDETTKEKLQSTVVDEIAEEPYQGGDDDVDCFEKDYNS
ncbi:hypothetical protein BJ166DRAFT_518147 [Pestalotiopsis sp. NC0098]|nr:hypothetical protein BJ166DRAFT_518147 [Pestalotiopsis sp. NC0098]